MSSVLERFRRFIPDSGPLASAFVLRVILGVLVVGLAAVPLVVSTPPIGLVEGRPAPRTYRANRQVQFVDEDATAKLRLAARDAVQPVLALDGGALGRAEERVGAFFSAVGGQDAVRPAGSVRLAEDHGVSAETVRLAASLDADGEREAARVTEELVAAHMTSRFDAAGLGDARMRLEESASVLSLPANVRTVVADVGAAALRPTVLEDEAATKAAEDSAVARVSPVVVVKQAGENIVVRGEVVTSQHMDIVASLGQMEGGGGAGAIASVVGLLALLVAAAGGYLHRYERQVWDRFRDLAVVGTLFVGMVVATRSVIWLFPEASPFVMPIPLAAMLATLLISPRIGLVLTVLTAGAGVLLGFTTGLNVVAAVVASVAAIVAMSSLTQRRHLVYAGVTVVGSVVACAALATLASGASTDAVLSSAGYASAGGVLSVVLAYGLLPFFEYVFGVTTDVRLLELCSPGAPLLRELMAKAPGTYSHSVLVGSLAETAADAIGANPLLARVGAYYHDIGKMSRPVFFAENQCGEANPHDDKTPWLSASIITAHVRDGITMGERGRLPSEVVDIIRQHHGDSLVSYFYSRAADSGQPVHENDFRYASERPKSPEAALVMLADSVEAYMRCTRSPTLPEVEAAVRRVVGDKVADDQLDDSRLTLADIETVVRVYAKMLVSIYHPRVKYPSCPVRRPEDAGTCYEPSRT